MPSGAKKRKKVAAAKKKEEEEQMGSISHPPSSTNPLPPQQDKELEQKGEMESSESAKEESPSSESPVSEAKDVSIEVMHGISNTFSVLNLVGDDDAGQMTTLVSTKDETAKSDKEKKNKEISGNNVTLKNEENQENLLDPPKEYKFPLVWIDLEMTGLDVEVDRILEIACIITDGKLIRSVEGPDLVIQQSKDCLDKMGEWCQEHHGASGLTERVLQSTITEQDAEKQVIEFVKKHVASDTNTPLLAGNSVYVDLVFLKKYMPDLAGLFSHVLVDVSSVAALCSRWFPKARKKAPSKEKNHRAMGDIRESIRELKYYRESIFKPMSKSPK